MAIPPTPMMTDIIVQLMVAVLSVLALATKQMKQGRFSKYTVTYTPRGSLRHREVYEEVVGGARDRGCPAEVGSIDPGRGSDDCYTDLGCGLWSCR